MRYYRIDEDGILFAVGIGMGGTEISQAEYKIIRDVIEARPVAPEGYEYILLSSGEWKLNEVPEMSDEDPLLSDGEALEIILGGEKL